MSETLFVIASKFKDFSRMVLRWLRCRSWTALRWIRRRLHTVSPDLHCWVRSDPLGCGCCGPPCPGSYCRGCWEFRPLSGFEEIFAADAALKVAGEREDPRIEAWLAAERAKDPNFDWGLLGEYQISEEYETAVRNYHEAWSRAPDYEPVEDPTFSPESSDD